MDPDNYYTHAGAMGDTLFGPGGPSFADVAQGSAGDCWYLASLAETAARDPQIIENMFIPNDNGTWTVCFYINGTPDYVTVNDQLPVSAADPSYNDGFAFDDPLGGILWVALAEKAFAQENLSGQIDTSQPGEDSYEALNGGEPSVALAAITGLSSVYFDVTPGQTAQQIAEALQAGDLVCIDTPDSSGIDPQLVGGHCYAVVGYDPSSSLPFEVLNPWGVRTYDMTGGQYYGLFTANGTFLEENFVDGGVAGSAADHAMGSPDSMPSGTLGDSNQVSMLLAAASSQPARTGTDAAVHSDMTHRAAPKRIVIGPAPTSRAGQLTSIGRGHDHHDLALGSLMDEDLEFLRA
jgi:hypothetical protein